MNLGGFFGLENTRQVQIEMCIYYAFINFKAGKDFNEKISLKKGEIIFL